MTITDVLLSKYYRGNQTLLATDLKISRVTLRKYMSDDEGEFHFIRANGVIGPAELFTNQSNKVTK